MFYLPMSREICQALLIVYHYQFPDVWPKGGLIRHGDSNPAWLVGLVHVFIPSAMAVWKGLVTAPFPSTGNQIFGENPTGPPPSRFDVGRRQAYVVLPHSSCSAASAASRMACATSSSITSRRGCR